MYSDEKLKELTDFTKEVRIETLNQLAARGFGHLGGSMSIVEILTVLYCDKMKYDPKNPTWKERDWLVCSKGHAGPSVYSTLALKGFFPMDWLKTLNQHHTNLPSHCDRTKTPGIDMTTGSLGQGLSVATGIALGFNLAEEPNYVYCITGDGELQEGQNWEAIMFAAQRELGNLILLVDSNKLQLDSTLEAINNLEPYEDKFKSFNWNVLRVDGHNLNAISDAIDTAKASTGKPTAIICDTIKGKGVVWAEGVFNHHIEVNQAQADEAIAYIRAN